MPDKPADQRALAGLMGPVLLAVDLTEVLDVCSFGQVTAAVVFLNGTILFTAGLAVVHVHNRWNFRWPVVVTVTGWLALAPGLARMIFRRCRWKWMAPRSSPR